MILLLNDSTSVHLDGAVLCTFWHDVRIRAVPMVLPPEEYTLGYLKSFGLQAESEYKAKLLAMERGAA